MGIGRGLGRDMEGCGKFVKWIVFLVNFLIFVGGLAVLSVGIWTLIDKAFIQRLLRNELFVSSAYILIVAGCFVVFISFLGCLGALKEVKCMLLTYFICLFLMFVVLVIGGILGYVFKNQVEHNLRPEMKHTIELYQPNNPKDPITAAWDDTQRNVPESCCKLGPGGQPLNCTSGDVDKLFQNDCFSEGLKFVREHANYVAGVAIGFSSFLVLGMIFSMCLFKLIE